VTSLGLANYPDDPCGEKELLVGLRSALCESQLHMGVECAARRSGGPPAICMTVGDVSRCSRRQGGAFVKPRSKNPGLLEPWRSSTDAASRRVASAAEAVAQVNDSLQ
jgi:hypothetical protein